MPGRRVTVILIPKVDGDLHRLQQRTNLSLTDLANRAITLYEFFDARTRAGYDMFARDQKTGRTELVELLDAGSEPGDAYAPRPLQAGLAAQSRRSGRHRLLRKRGTHQPRSSGHDRPRRQKGWLRKQLLHPLSEKTPAIEQPTWTDRKDELHDRDLYDSRLRTDRAWCPGCQSSRSSQRDLVPVDSWAVIASH